MKSKARFLISILVTGIAATLPAQITPGMRASLPPVPRASSALDQLNQAYRSSKRVNVAPAGQQQMDALGAAIATSRPCLGIGRRISRPCCKVALGKPICMRNSTFRKMS